MSIEKTPNYNLNKPGYDNFGDIADLNENADILDAALQNKVDKEAGKGLSANDYTTAEKSKLAGLTDLSSHVADKNNPHQTTKIHVGLGNVPNVTTNDQTPTHTQAATLTNIASGETLTIAFGKIRKAIADFISHIGNVSNPHSVTYSQTGAAPTVNPTFTGTVTVSGTAVTAAATDYTTKKLRNILFDTSAPTGSTAWSNGDIFIVYKA